jgi:hypothetical protein
MNDQAIPVRFPAEKIDFYFLHSIKTDSGAYLASYPLGTGVKRPRRDADHSPPSSVQVKKDGATPPLFYAPFLPWRLFKWGKDKFTSLLSKFKITRKLSTDL